jgi:diacylglycerol kinase (ATP)
MTATLHIAILVNPSSGAGKGIKAGEQLKAALLQRKIHFSFFAGDWPSDLNPFTEVWLVGGDGTVNYFINKYHDLQIPFALFKGGTGNDFAWKLYGDITIAQQIELVLNATTKRVDAGSCNGRLYVNSLGIGFDGEVLKSISTIRWLGGHLGYLFIVLKKIFSFKEFSFRITTISGTSSQKYLLVIVNNSSRTGGGFMVSPKASLTDGLLDLVLCGKLPVLKRLRYLPVIEKGKHLDLPFIHYTHEQEVTIACEHEVFAQVDGELISADSFDIKVMKGYLSIKY